MESDQVRVIALAVVAIALLVASVFVMDWFVARTSAEVMGIDRLGIDLRTIHGCARGGACGSFPISKGGGSYSTWAAMTFYGTMGVGLLLVAAVAQRLMRHDENPGLARLGYGATYFGNAQGAPTMGFGYRAELDSFALDVSFLNYQIRSSSDSYNAAAGYYGSGGGFSGSLLKLEGLYFLKPRANASARARLVGSSTPMPRSNSASVRRPSSRRPECRYCSTARRRRSSARGAPGCVPTAVAAARKASAAF